MESVTVLMYVLIGLFLAPAAWFAWFGLDEVLRPARPRGAH